MKLCGLKLKIFFICLPFLALGFLLVGHGANAEITENGSSYYYKKSTDDTNGNFTLSNNIPPGCDNRILIATIITYTDGYHFDSVSYDGVAMIDSGLGEESYLGSSHIRWQTYYIVNPPTGTANFHARNTRGNYSDPMTINLNSYCGVDQITPLDSVSNISGTGTNLNTNYFNITNDNSAVIYNVMVASTAEVSGTVGYTGSSTPMYDDGNATMTKFFGSPINLKITSDYYFVSGSTIISTQKEIDKFVLNPAQPKINIYTFGYPYLWSLDNSIFKINEDKKFIVSWNACDEYDILNKAKIHAVINDDPSDSGSAVIFDKTTYVGPQECKNIITYFTDNYLINNDAESGEVYFILTTWDENNVLISSKKSNSINFQTETSGTYISSLMNDPLMIDLGNLPMGPQTSTTTTLFFSYDFTDQNAASTTVILWDYTNATSTGYYQDGPFVSSGVGWSYITIPTPTINTFKNYKFVAVRPGYSNLQSSLFSVNWSFALTPETPECNPPSYDFSHLCDEIENATSTLFGQLRCSIKFGITVSLTGLFSPNCDSIVALQDNYNDFKESFPFNVYFELADTIDTAVDSASSSTSTTAAFRIPLIRKTATSSEYYMASGISSTSVSNTIGTSNYSVFYLTVGFVYWILLAFITYLVLRKI
jgi:hypothetical protein